MPKPRNTFGVVSATSAARLHAGLRPRARPEQNALNAEHIASGDLKTRRDSPESRQKTGGEVVQVVEAAIVLYRRGVKKHRSLERSILPNDSGDKLRAYELEGLKECWILDLVRKTVHIHRLKGDR
jgi:hypothetical protein